VNGLLSSVNKLMCYFLDMKYIEIKGIFKVEIEVV